MTFHFRPAVREQTSLLVALAGASGTGKTLSAMKLARGLVGGDDSKIAVIDTEAGRALHYAVAPGERPGPFKFAFQHGDLKPPFRPQAYMDAIAAADKAGFGAIVVDSMSHEYEGEGGVLEWAEELEEKGVRKPGNWKEPKTSHKRLVSRLLQCRAHLIFCLRAEEKMLVKQETDPATGRKKTVVVAPEDRPLRERWVPICEKRFMYEMTASFLLLPDRPGIPVPVKLQDQHRHAFPDGQPISERAGELLAEWARGGASPAQAATIRWLTPTGEKAFATVDELVSFVMRGINSGQASAVAIRAARERNAAIMAELSAAGYGEQMLALSQAFDQKLGAAA